MYFGKQIVGNYFKMGTLCNAYNEVSAFLPTKQQHRFCCATFRLVYLCRGCAFSPLKQSIKSTIWIEGFCICQLLSRLSWQLIFLLLLPVLPLPRHAIPSQPPQQYSKFPLFSTDGDDYSETHLFYNLRALKARGLSRKMGFTSPDLLCAQFEENAKK